MTTAFLTAPDRACRDADPAEFVPEPRDAPAIDAAKATCKRCPYIADCLAWAHEVGDYHAVLGATTGPERALSAGHARASRAAAVAARRDRVAELAGQGLTDRAIADRLGVTRDIVYTDRTHDRKAA